MSEENVEIARHFFEALNREDPPGGNEGREGARARYERFAESYMTADFAFDFSRSRSPERGVYGREDIPRFGEVFTGVWESIRWEAEEFIDAGDQLVTSITTYNRGREGIEVQVRVAWLWSFRNGRVQRITFFQDRAEALEAAGLSE